MIDNERGRVTKRPLRPCGKRHHHRAASHIARSEKITTDDYAKPLLLPRRILWCGKGGAAQKWLRRTHLPWWFFGSFINRCYYHRSGKGTLTQCLRRYPMDEQALMKEMEDYFFAWAKGEEDINHTVLVDLYELEHHSHPATFLKEAQEELLWQVQQAPEVDRFYLLQKRKWYPGTLTEEEKEFLRINPTGCPTFSLPIRSEVSHSVTTSTHAQRIPAIVLSRQRQADDTLNPGGVVIPAPESKNKSSALSPVKSRTFSMPFRPGVQKSIRAAPESMNENNDFLVLRSKTCINRASFFGRYQGQRANR
ncbi:hypothetical protein KCU67_g9187, partial [Aureobasidium melanogenum]